MTVYSVYRSPTNIFKPSSEYVFLFNKDKAGTEVANRKQERGHLKMFQKGWDIQGLNSQLVTLCCFRQSISQLDGVSRFKGLDPGNVIGGNEWFLTPGMFS